MHIFLTILVFIIGIAISGISFKAKKESIYYLLLTIGVSVIFYGVFMAVPK